jgi:SAM-dependent methyltransferase
MGRDEAAKTATAYQHWDQTWRQVQGRSGWSRADPWVAAIVPELRRRGVRHVLDLGCGIGRHAAFFARQGFTCHGMDASEAAIAHARQTADPAGEPAGFTVADLGAIPYPAGYFEYVLAFNVVYHGDAAAVSRAVSEVRRVLCPGGLYQTTMLSARNGGFGHGVAVGPGTYRQPDASDDKIHPHFYCDARGLLAVHDGFDLVSAFDAEQGKPGSFHWHCVFETAPA